MKKYVKPQVEIQQFTICDVITTSGVNNRELLKHRIYKKL